MIDMSLNYSGLQLSLSSCQFKLLLHAVVNACDINYHSIKSNRYYVFGSACIIFATTGSA